MKKMSCVIVFVIFFCSSEAFKLNNFISDVVSHFGYNGIQLYQAETLLEDSEFDQLFLDLWRKDSYVALYDGLQNSDPIFVLHESDPNLKEVDYKHNQIWFMNVNNLEYISHWKLRLDSLVFLWKEVDECHIELKELYAVKDGDRITNDILIWNCDSHLFQNTSVNDIWHRRSNLNGIVLIDILLIHDIIQKYSNIDENGKVDAEGYSVDVMNQLMKRMNFTRKVIEPPDGQWGVLTENDQFNGIVGQLQNGNGDLSSAGLSIVLERSLVIDYSTTFYQGILTMITKASYGKPTMDFLVYVEIFPISAWILYCITILFSSGIIYSISKMNIENMHNTKGNKTFSLSNALALILLIVLQMDFSISKKTLATRTIFFTMCICSFLMFSYYAADLTSLMTSGPAPSSIKSFGDAFNAGLAIGFREGTSHETIIKNSPKGSSLHKFQASGQVLAMSMIDYEHELLHGDSNVFLLADPAGYWHNSSFQVTILNDVIKDDTAIGFPKDSEFVGLFNYHIKKLRESGIMEAMHKDNFPKTLPLELNPLHATILGYQNVLFPFLILLVGMSVSAFISILENRKNYLRIA